MLLHTLMTIILIYYLLTINANIQISFKKFHRYKDIKHYLRNLRQEYSDKVNIIKLGKSVEGRAIDAVKIGINENIEKPAILIDAGIHAREWMTNLAALYIIDQLTTKPENGYLIQNVDWYIIPVLNPDGYEYTHQVNRMWRKNRKIQTKCRGVDINRNFPFEWDSENNECSEIYEGSKPNSEPETLLLQRFVLQRRSHIKLYISLHAFGSYIFYPWAFTNDKISNYLEYEELGENAARAIHRLRGTTYQVGTVGRLMYIVSGSSLDWMVAVAKVPMAFAIELVDSSESFHPPLKERLNISKELVEGLKEFHKYVEYTWVFNKTYFINCSGGP